MAPSRQSKPPPPPTETLVLDNGAYTIKAGLASADQPPTTSPLPKIIPNCMARDRERKVYVGSDLEKCKDFGEIVFRRPVEKGYLVNWEGEKEIWDHEFFDTAASFPVYPKETGLILTEAPNGLPVLQSNCDQVIFEEFQFARYYRCIGPSLNAYNDIQHIFKAPPRNPESPVTPAEVLLVIDSGYSHTTVTPLIQGRPIQPAIRRLDVGGKLLTNHLTRLLSIRHYDMRNEPHLVNDIKEASSYLSRDFSADLEKSWKGTQGERRHTYLSGSDGIAKDYVLPDYHKIMKGYIRDHDPSHASKARRLAAQGISNPEGIVPEDIITLRNERFTVPELLFRPTDIGLRQPGIAQIVMQSLAQVPTGLWPGFLANIFVVGGNAKIEGFIQKLYQEVRELAPAECIVRVAKPPDPCVSTWQGGANLVRNEERLKECSVTREEYEEFGQHWVARKFAGGK